VGVEVGEVFVLDIYMYIYNQLVWTCRDVGLH